MGKILFHCPFITPLLGFFCIIIYGTLVITSQISHLHLNRNTPITNVPQHIRVRSIQPTNWCVCVCVCVQEKQSHLFTPVNTCEADRRTHNLLPPKLKTKLCSLFELYGSIAASSTGSFEATLLLGNIERYVLPLNISMCNV